MCIVERYVKKILQWELFSCNGHLYERQCVLCQLKCWVSTSVAINTVVLTCRPYRMMDLYWIAETATDGIIHVA